jgi:hypothetical protein
MLVLFVITFGLFYQPGIVEAASLTMQGAERYLKKEGYQKSKEEEGLWENSNGQWANIREVDLV